MIQADGTLTEVSIVVTPNALAAVFLLAAGGLLLFATAFVIVRGIQLHISWRGAWVPFVLFIVVYTGVTAWFRSAATELVQKLKRAMS